MKSLKIAASRSCPDCFTTTREMVDVSASDYIDVAAVVLAISDISSGAIEEIEATGFGIPVFIATHKEEIVPAEGVPVRDLRQGVREARGTHGPPGTNLIKIFSAQICATLNFEHFDRSKFIL